MQTADETRNEARAINALGNEYLTQGKFAEALSAFTKTVALLEQISDTINVARALSNIGNVYYSLDDYPRALEYQLRAHDIHTVAGNSEGVARTASNIGLIHVSLQRYSEAQEWFKKSLDIHSTNANETGQATAIGNLGIVHSHIGNFNAAYECFQQARSMHHHLHERDNHVRLTCNIVRLLIDNGRYNDAETEAAKVSVDDIVEPGVRANHLASLADIQLWHGNLDASTTILLSAVELSRQYGLRSSEADYHKALCHLAQKRNDFAAYIEHNNEYTRITEEIRGREATQKLAMMEAERSIEAERRERDKERALLYGALPKSVADRMIRGEKVSGDHYDNASVIFLDIVGFTTISDRIPPGHVVHLLSQIFSTLDEVCKGHCVTKIKTIGDSYMAVAGVPESQDDHAQRAAHCALDMLAALNTLEVTMPPELGDTSWVKDVGDIQVRIGLHCGPVTAGVIGTERLQYDVWGDTVNVASRMESTSEPGRIQVSEAFAHALGTGIRLRGTMDIKGKGQMKTYWLEDHYDE